MYLHSLYDVALGQHDSANDGAPQRRAQALRKRETAARVARLSAERKIERTREDRCLTDREMAGRLADLKQKQAEARNDERLATRELFDLTRAHFRSRGLKPMQPGHLASLMRPDELMLAYDVGREDSVLLVLLPDGEVLTSTLKWPDQLDVSSGTLASTIWRTLAEVSAQRPEPDRRIGDAKAYSRTELFDTLIPLEIRNRIHASARVFLVPDGSLHRLPFETLIMDARESRRWVDDGPPIVYGPSATVLMAQRQRVARQQRNNRERRPPALVAIGDPIFSRGQPDKAPGVHEQAPQYGVLLAMVQPNLNAAKNGLRGGDVLLDYDGTRLETPADLGPAIEGAASRLHNGGTVRRDPAGVVRGGSESNEQTVVVKVWRDGKTMEITLVPGRMGVRPSQLTMPEALRVHRELQQSEDERYAALASANTRDGFGTLRPLPGTRIEVNAIAARTRKAGIDPTAIKLLTGEDATLTRLFEAVDRPRFLHLATHRLVDSGRKVYESAVALTVPEQLTPEDFGFLRLQDLLYKWAESSKAPSWSCSAAAGPRPAGSRPTTASSA